MPAHQRDVHEVGAGRRLRQRIELGELRARHQLVRLYHVAVEIRQDRRRTADSHEPEDQRMQKQRAEVDAVHHTFSFQAAKRAQGARAPTTQKSGQRKTTTPTNASITKATAANAASTPLPL